MRNFLTPWLVLPTVVVGMALLIVAAVRADCARLFDEYAADVQMVDDELRTLEGRWLALVEGRSVRPASIDGALAAYRKTTEASERHEAYRVLVQRFRDTTTAERSGEWGPAAVSSGFVDEAAGIANRWQNIYRDYQERASARDAFVRSWRGGMAGLGDSGAVRAPLRVAAN